MYLFCSIPQGDFQNFILLSQVLDAVREDFVIDEFQRSAAKGSA